MAHTTFDRYLESEVLSADPVKLVNILYRGCIEAVGAARRHLALGQIPERSRQIQKAWDILYELSQSLRPEQSGELARSLSELYGYMQQRLIDANTRQADAPLAEVESLLTTIGEAWREVKAPAPEADETALVSY